MPVPSDSFRLNAYLYRDMLLDAYQAAPGRPGATVFLAMMQEQLNTMLGMYEKWSSIPLSTGLGPLSDDSPSGHERRGMRRLFRKWRKRTRDLAKRLDSYWEDVNDPGQQANPTTGVFEDMPQPAYTNEWVALPVLEGVWPDAYYLGFETPSVPDAVELAQLWNELMAVKDVVDAMNEEHSIDQLVAEWFMRVSTELQKSAPGEDETWADHIDDGLHALDDGMKHIWELAKEVAWYVAVTAAVLVGGVIAYKVVQR